MSFPSQLWYPRSVLHPQSCSPLTCKMKNKGSSSFTSLEEMRIDVSQGPINQCRSLSSAAASPVHVA